jgi:zinc transport system substrate-binding protein
MRSKFAKSSFIIASSVFFGGSALADAPRVVADIAPVHSLVSMVMGDLGQVTLLLPQETSPHGYSLRPSQAGALSQADIVFWIGQDLTPWLEGPLHTIAENAQHVGLLQAPGTTQYAFRRLDEFGPAHDDDHAHDHDAHDDHHEEDHDHGHGGHDTHHDHDDHHTHDHDGTDPHAWLDPANAQVWLSVIAANLSEYDPENAATYTANAQTAQAMLQDLDTQIAQQLDHHHTPFIVFHDAYQYFETRYGLRPAGVVHLSDASDAGPAHLQNLRAQIAELGHICAFSEPQFNHDILDNVFAGLDMHVATLDPLGAGFEPGATLYPNVITAMADAFADCNDHNR